MNSQSEFRRLLRVEGAASSFICEISSLSVTVATDHPKAIMLVTYTSLASLAAEKYTTIPEGEVVVEYTKTVVVGG